MRAVVRREGGSGLALGAVATGAKVRLDLVGLLAALPVAVLQQSLRDGTAAQPEGERQAQRQREHDRGERDPHDLLGDAQLLEDHEHRDHHDQGRHDRGDDLAGGGVAHDLRDARGDRTRDERGHDEDQDRDDDVGQVGQDVVHEARQRRHLEGADGGEEEEDEDQPEDHAGDAVGGAGARHHAVDVLVRVRGVQVAVETDLVEHLAGERGHDLRHDEADDEQDDEAEQVRQEAEEPVGRSLEAVPNVHGVSLSGSVMGAQYPRSVETGTSASEIVQE
jgi:hypothetical protein